MPKNVHDAGKKRSKKGAVVFLALLAGLLLLCGLLSLVLHLMPDGETEETYDFSFYEPDYEAKILEDDAYLLLDRRIRYSDGFGTWDISDGDTVLTEDALQLFLIRYISALVEGDADALRSFYTEKAAEAARIPEKFSGQRIYGTVFTEMSRTEMSDSEESNYLVYEIRVEYRIDRNDGTFRRDIDSDAVRAQYFVIENRSTGIRISDVIRVRKGR